MTTMENVKKIIIIIIGSLLIAISMNWFIEPAGVYGGGFTGVAQLFSKASESIGFPISTGIFFTLLNIPVIIVAWKKIGRSFTIYSFLSVATLSFFMQIIPVKAVFSNDILLNAIFGGIIMAIGTGYTLKYGASTGGLDIVAIIVSKYKDQPLGTFFFAFNAVIVITAGYLYGWEKALYTLISLYATTRVIDAIYTRHVKVTVFIVTSKGSALKDAIHERLVRGITTLEAKGAYTNTEKEVFMIVLTRYELYELEKIIHQVDPTAFTNVVQTIGVYGLFRKD
ncbi:MAG: YitT family protein [Bacillaceae bacterium]